MSLSKAFDPLYLVLDKASKSLSFPLKLHDGAYANLKLLLMASP